MDATLKTFAKEVHHTRKTFRDEKLSSLVQTKRGGSILHKWIAM